MNNDTRGKIKVYQASRDATHIMNPALIITLNAGSSQHGKHRRASTAANCVTAMFANFPLY
jgi:hypothetical protein